MVASSEGQDAGVLEVLRLGEVATSVGLARLTFGSPSHRPAGKPAFGEGWQGGRTGVMGGTEGFGVEGECSRESAMLVEGRRMRAQAVQHVVRRCYLPLRPRGTAVVVELAC